MMQHLGTHHEELRRAGHARRRLLALNTEADLLRLIAYAETYPKGEPPTSIPGGREVADALAMGERMNILREIRAAIKPEVATWAPHARDKVLCAGSWLLPEAAPVYESTEVVVGDRTYSIKQCTQHCLGSGSKLWASAVALARHLVTHASTVRGRRVVELGAGVGLVARVTCDLGAAEVLATDGEERLLDLVRANAPDADVRRLDWAAPGEQGTFDVVLGADLIYSSGAVASGLLETCTALCRPGGTLVLCAPRGRHGLNELVDAMRRDARWAAATVERFSATDVADGHTFLLVTAARSENLPHPVRSDSLQLRRSGQLPASTGRCGEASGLPPPAAPEYVPHGRRPA